MLNNTSFIMAFSGIAVFLCVIAGFVIEYAYNPKNTSKNSVWLFDNWKEKLYIALFGDKKPENVAKKVAGIDVPKYLHNCKLLKISNNLKSIIIDRLIGYFIVIIGLILFLITFNPILLIIFILTSIPFIFLPMFTVSNNLKKRRLKITDELPRYLDLLHTALLVDMPIETAIEITSKHLSDTIIAEEMLRALADAQIGAYSWQDSLQNLATDYEIDTLSDFVLDIVTAYNNGTSIVESVERKSRDIKHSNLLSAKERATKLTNTILIPVTIFKIVPLLAYMCIPVIYQLNSGAFGF